MKKLGYILITFAFLAGSLTAVLDKLNVQWGHFITAIIIGTAGIVMVHLSERRSSRSGEKIAANLQDIDTSMARIVENIKQLKAEKESTNPYDVRHRIDELFRDDLMSFAEARESIAHAHSLQAYADIMSHFAAGERYLNRVWSASADGYIDEITAYIDKAQTQFVETLEKVRQLEISAS